MSAAPIGDPRRASVLGLLAALAASAVVVLLLTWRTPTPILSYDDIFRTRFAHDWAVSPYFFTERLVWLPLPLIATGLAMRVTGEALGTALAVNLLATALAIGFVHRVADRLFGPLAAWTAATLFGLTPWVVFLALSRYSEPVMLATTAAGVHYWLRWSDAHRGRDLAWAGLALGAAVLTRYEAWPLGLALPVHVGAMLMREHRVPTERRVGASGLWSALPAALMATWAAKNLSVYGTPVYGGAFGFLPDSAPAGVLGGAALTLRYLWELSPLVSALAVLGALLAWRRGAPLIGFAVLAALVPWYTVSLFRVEVALQVRLMLLPLMLLAPLAGALTPWLGRRWRPAVLLVPAMVAAQFAADLGLAHPGHDLPMTRLALRLQADGTLGRFDSIYVESPRPIGYPDEVRVATNFRRDVGVMVDSSAAPWRGTRAESIIVFNDGKAPPGGPAGNAFVVSREGAMTAWGVCDAREEPRAEWLGVSVPSALVAGGRAVVRVTLKNAGAEAWRMTACAPAIEARWRGDGGAVAPVRVALSGPVAPGGTTTAEIPIHAPSGAGEYALDLDLVGGGAPPDRARRGNPASQTVRVTRERR